MARIWFLFASFCLLSTKVFSDETPKPWTDEQYSKKLQYVLDLLWWLSSLIEVRNQNNVLIFAIPSVTDVYTIYDLMDEATKKKVAKTFYMDEETQTLSINDADAEFRKAFPAFEMSVKTIFYGTDDETRKRNLTGLMFSGIKSRIDSFVSYSNSDDDFIRGEFLKRVGAVKKDDPCYIRYCPVQELVSSKPPFAILTVATWTISALNITSDTGFQWSENVEFAVSDTMRPKIDTARYLDKFDYAEFQYRTKENCMGRVLRLPYKQNFSLLFVIPSKGEICSSSDDLWVNVEQLNRNSPLTYKKQTMFVSIPLFKVDASIDVKVILNATALAQAFHKPSSRLYNASAWQAWEVYFSPKLPEETEIPTIPEGTPSFLVERPFFFALLHSLSNQPLVAGLVNSPMCSSNCSEMSKYRWT